MLHELRMDLGIPEPHLRFQCILKLIHEDLARHKIGLLSRISWGLSRLGADWQYLELEESEILHTRNEGELERGMLA